jgi:hypothetical protein
VNFTIQQIDATFAVSLLPAAVAQTLSLQQAPAALPVAVLAVTAATIALTLAPALSLSLATPGSIQTTFVFVQARPASRWTIVHGLGCYPSVDVVDSTGATVEGDVQYVSSNEITLSFMGGFSGTAYLN